MPKLSRNTVAVEEQGPGRAWTDKLNGYTVNVVETTADADLSPLLQGLPNDQCHAWHWGYVFKGSMWWRFDDHEEVTGAGEAFVIPPGHTSGAAGDSEFVVFSPTKEMDVVEANMARRAQELYGAPQLKG